MGEHVRMYTQHVTSFVELCFVMMNFVFTKMVQLESQHG